MDSGTAAPAATGTRGRVARLLFVAPACSLLLGMVLWLILIPGLPGHIARHVGPDGVGYSPTWLALAIMFAAATLAFAIGAATARGFIRDGHWYPTQKAISVGIMSLGYGILGVAVGTVLSTWPGDDSGNAVAAGMLGSLALFAVAACVYTVRLPRARQEPLGGEY